MTGFITYLATHLTLAGGLAVSCVPLLIWNARRARHE